MGTIVNERDFLLSQHTGQFKIILPVSACHPAAAQCPGQQKTTQETIKGGGQNYYTRTGPTKPQNSWWYLPAPPLLNVKRWCLYCIATPLSSSKKLQ